MSVICYNFAEVYSLKDFVSGLIKKGPAGKDDQKKQEWSAAENNLPETGGIYVIKSDYDGKSNSYVGIAQNLRKRFASRHEAVHHLGIDQEIMAMINVWRGDVQIWDSPANFINAADQTKYSEVPQPNKAEQGELRPFSYFPMVQIDAMAAVSVEHILIRFYISENSPIDTNTNTALAQTPFVNKTNRDIICYLKWSNFDKARAGKSMRFLIPANSAL